VTAAIRGAGGADAGGVGTGAGGARVLAVDGGKRGRAACIIDQPYLLDSPLRIDR
jgi:hypothetical protein